MTTDNLSPLGGVKTIDDLLAMPYFEFLACLGEFSLHPGGLQATVDLLRLAGLRDQDRVLEIGCGTGLTTRALLAAGLDVTVVEPCSRMLQATLRNCSLGAGRRPTHYQCRAEDLSQLPARFCDLVLYECVFGFVLDPRKAVVECARVMAPPSPRVCVIDLHYVTEPPRHVRAALKEIFGQELALLYENDWRDLFSGFHEQSWEVFDVPRLAAPDASGVERLLRRSGQLDLLPDAGHDGFEKIAARWRLWNDVFLENKTHMRAHRAIWTLYS